MAKRSTVAQDGDTYTYTCDYGPTCEFTSAGWSTKKAATDRGAQHEQEHNTGEAMPELAEFQKGQDR